MPRKSSKPRPKSPSSAPQRRSTRKASKPPKQRGTPPQRNVAVYARVSSKRQDLASQLPDLKRYADNCSSQVKWYRDKAPGRTMDRPSWNKLQEDLRAGKIGTLVVWRLDRLGRTAAGLTQLFEELQRLNVNLVSIRDGVDLSTAAGRLMANVIASIAAYDNEVRSERIVAGIEAARAKGKKIGGGKPGRRCKVTEEKEKAIKSMKVANHSVASIARTLGLSRTTVYAVLR